MNKRILLVFAMLASLLAFSKEAEDPSLLLKATYDGYTTIPEIAVDKDVSKFKASIPQDLQLRMFPNVKGEGNSVCLQHLETVTYSMANFSPDCGTVAFWYCPQNYDFTESKYAQVFFEVRNSGIYRFMIFKPTDYENRISFLLEAGTNSSHTVMAEVNAKPGEWHHVACVWDANSMKIYSDGKLSKPYQSKTLTTPMPLPKTVPHCDPKLNDPSGWLMRKGFKELNWATAYDEVEIYNCKLSQNEITAKYEKYFPSNFAGDAPRPIASVPRGNGITLDGKIDDAEWADASMLPIQNICDVTKEQTVFPTTAYLKHCDGKLLAAFSCPIPASKYAATAQDGNVWEDDSADIYLLGPDGVIYHFIINSAGGLYDAKQPKDAATENVKWNSTAKTRGFRGTNFWTAEIEIPLKEIGVDTGKPIEGLELKGNLGTTLYSPYANYCGWGRSFGYATSYATPDFYGKIVFGGADCKVRYEGISEIGNTRLFLKPETPAGCTAEASWLSISGQNSKANHKMLVQGWESTLPAGLCLVSWSVKNAKKETIYSSHIVQDVKRPLDILYECHYLKKRTNVTIDYAELKKGQTYSGKVQFISLADKKVWNEVKFQSQKTKCEVTLPFDGDYPMNADFAIRVTLDGNAQISAEKKFRTPATYEYPRIAVNHDVPRPWEKVQAGSNAVNVLDRTYTFASGPLPSKIVSRGETVLPSLPKFNLNGEDIAWGKAVFGENHGDYIEISGKGQAGQASFTCKGELWFDGMYKFDLTMTPPNGGLDIESFKLTWNTPNANAKYVMSPVYVPWKEDGTLDLQWNTKELYSVLSTVGLVNGLTWWNRSDANWVIDKNKTQIHLRQGEKRTKITVDIISKKSRLNKPAGYTMVFMATPPRHPEPLWRHRHHGCSIPNTNYVMLSGSTAKGVFEPTNLTYYTNIVPAHPELFGKTYQDRVEKHGQRGIIYTFPPHISRMDREFDACYPTWATKPGLLWGGKDEFSGESFYSCPVCSNTPASDREVAQAADVFEKYPYVYGIYFDISHVASCDNELHGHGGIDSFGQRFSCSEALEMRSFFMRIYKLHRMYPEKFMVLHAHNKFFPFVHDFADAWVPGEEQYAGYCAKPFWYYMEEIPFEAYQSAWNSEIRGVGVQMIPQEERALILSEAMKKHRDWIVSEATVMRRISVIMLHDINCWECMWSLRKKHPLSILWGINDKLDTVKATFHGYWFNNVVYTENPVTKASWYSWADGAGTPYRRAIVVVNTSREETTAKLKIDWKNFGIDPKTAQFQDLWNDKPITIQEINSTRLPGNYFLYIGVK